MKVFKNIDEGRQGGDEQEEEDSPHVPSRPSQSLVQKKGKGVAQSTRTIFPSSSSNSDDGNNDDDDDDDGDTERRGGDDDSGDYGGGSGGGGGGGHSSLLRGDDEYYVTQDTDHGYRPGIDAQRQHLARLTEISSGDDFSSGHNDSLGIDNQMRAMGIGFQDYGGYGVYGQPNHASTGYGYDFHGDLGYSSSSTGSMGHLPPIRQLERSTSTSTGGYYDRARRRHRDTSASTATGGGGGYSGYDLGQHHDGSSSSSVEYRGAGYYHPTEPVNLSQPQNPYYESSSQSSQPEPSDYGSILFGRLHFPYPHTEFNNQGNNDDDFQPPRHSMWH